MFQYIREFWSKLDSSIKYRERQRLARQQEHEYESRGKLARLHKQETELDPPASG
jgi:hypothetical protein